MDLMIDIGKIVAVMGVLLGAVAYSVLLERRVAAAIQNRIGEPGSPDQSYLVLKLRGAAGWVGGIPTPMPVDDVLDEADVAAIEGWIANGAPND